MTESDRHEERTALAPRLSRILTTAVFGGFCLVGLFGVLETTGSLLLALLAAAIMGTLLVLQLRCIADPVAMRSRRHRRMALAAQGLLAYLPFFVFGEAWIGMPGFFAGSALLLLRERLGWSVFGGVVVSIALIQTVLVPEVGAVLYSTIATVTTGLIVYGLCRLSLIIGQLAEAREELARLAVAEERLRFSRDLHDLLGYSLSAVTLKAELARRLVVGHPGRAEREIAEMIEVLRQALADVRLVSSRYRDMCLKQESSAARAALEAADMDVEIEIALAQGELTRPVNTVLATVLREGVTNVLRHSSARRCRISVDEPGDDVRIELVNDGVRPARPGVVRDGNGGSGIESLRARVDALGGQLACGPCDGGRGFRLSAVVPRSPAAAPQRVVRPATPVVAATGVGTRDAG